MNIFKLRYLLALLLLNTAWLFILMFGLHQTFGRTCLEMLWNFIAIFLYLLMYLRSYRKNSNTLTTSAKFSCKHRAWLIARGNKHSKCNKSAADSFSKR